MSVNLLSFPNLNPADVIVSECHSLSNINCVRLSLVQLELMIWNLTMVLIRSLQYSSKKQRIKALIGASKYWIYGSSALGRGDIMCGIESQFGSEVVVRRCVELGKWGRSWKYQIKAKWGIHIPQHLPSKSTCEMAPVRDYEVFFCLLPTLHPRVKPISIHIDLIAPANSCEYVFPFSQLDPS